MAPGGGRSPPFCRVLPTVAITESTALLGVAVAEAGVLGDGPYQLGLVRDRPPQAGSSGRSPHRQWAGRSRSAARCHPRSRPGEAGDQWVGAPARPPTERLPITPAVAQTTTTRSLPNAEYAGRQPQSNPTGGTVTTTLDYTTALSAAHDDAASSLERSREQLKELLQTLDQQRAEINDELERVQRALATLKPTAPAAPPAATPEPPQARRRARGRPAAQARPPQPASRPPPRHRPRRRSRRRRDAEHGVGPPRRRARRSRVPTPTAWRKCLRTWARRTPRSLRSAPAWTAGRCITSSGGCWSSDGSSRALRKAAPSRMTGAARRWARRRSPANRSAGSWVVAADHGIERLATP
jgi:hypothetical protein